MSDIPAVLSDESAFVAALEAAGCKIRGRTCTCPFHDDRTPSAQWSQGQDGTWRMFCHVCQRYANAIDLKAHATGQDPRQAFKEAAKVKSDGSERKSAKSPPRPSSDDVVMPRDAVLAMCERLGRVERWYTYGPKSAPVLFVARIIQASGKKTFRQFTPRPGGVVPKNLVERGRIPLYRLNELGDRVLVVEGEKSADAAWSVGVPATTAAMGAGKAAESDWSPLKGRACYLWPDNDDTGRKHMVEVKAILERIGANVYLIDPAGIGLPPKGDVADLVEALDSKTQDEIQQTIIGIMDDAEPQGASRELAGLFDDIAAGKYEAIVWPDLVRTGELSKALLPGCITSLCADPGAGKSLLMLQMAAAWHRRGVPIAVLMLEDERRIHLQRVLAQTIGLADLTDDSWCKANAQRAHQMLDACRDEMDAIGARITAEGEDQLKLDQIAEWIDDQANGGARVIIVDPVTAAVTEREPWAADTAFLMKVKKIARTHGTSVVLVTHPRGTQRGASLGGMAGGSAYPRFSHAALWLEKFEMSELRDRHGEIVTCNRSIAITKARHGKGGGLTIGVLFNAETLRFNDVATLAPDQKKNRQSPPSRPADASHQKERLKQKPGPSEDIFNEDPTP